MWVFLYICGMEEVKPKVGGYLYCHTPVVMKNGRDQGKMATIKGKHYRILDIVGRRLYIRDNLGHTHSFTTDDFNEWFKYSDKVIRNIQKSVDNIIENDDFWS